MTIIDMDKVGEALNTKADIDLNNTGVFSTSEGGVVNLTSSTPANASGKEVTSADFFQSNLLNYTTNRILEIPQDIKLELNNGTLTLKAGSKVYVPNGKNANGSNKFDVRTVNQDIVFSKGLNGTRGILLTNGKSIDCPNITNCYSGETRPSATSVYWYDTASNYVKAITSTDASTDRSGNSLLIGIVTADGTSITSIDQVFNGFGYIGSTVFALPGVKVQIPNGRNEDGTCKSVYGTIRTVQQTSVNPGNGDFSIRIGDNFIAVSKFVYDVDTNYNYNQAVSPSNIRYQTNAGTVSYLSGKITSLKPFTVDSVVNSNEFYQLKDKTVTTDTAQTISGSKRFTQPPEGMSIDLVADTNQQIVPTVGGLRQLGLYRNSTYTKGDGYTSWLQATRGSDGWTATELYARRFLESDSQEIINYLRVNVTPEGIPISYTKTPPASVSGEEIVTAGWVNSKIQLVNELPANPVAGVLYCIPEK